MQNNRYKGLKIVLNTEAYSEPSRNSEMEIFAKIINDFSRCLFSGKTPPQGF